MFLLSSVLSAGTVLAQTPPDTTSESAQVAEAFAELDAVSTVIAGRLRDLAQRPAPPPPADAASSARADRKPCGTRKDMDSRIADLEERYDGFGQTINAANDDLPTHRDDVRDPNKVCTPQVEGNIDSAVNRLGRLQIESAYDVAVELLACVDRQRRTIDGELNQPDITTIRIQILADEMERLTDMTHRVQDMEQALLRAVSKRRRLVEELTQIGQAIGQAIAKDCAT